MLSRSTAFATGLPGAALGLALALLPAPALPAEVWRDAAAARAGAANDADLPRTLHATGLYTEAGGRQLRAGVAAFSPQYPLWSDGAAKRRWVWLPPGRRIDAAKPDAWQFPPGTRLWKEFAHGGRPVETRFITRRADGRWLYASYVWNEAGTEARLAPAEGLRDMPRKDAPDGRYDIPSRDDCRACHDSAPVPVLGLGALQLSPDRDPQAVHGVPAAAGELDLPGLVDRGWLRRLPPALLSTPPRIAAAHPVERAALGYLHANCGHCHNADGAPAPVALRLAQRVATPEASAQAVRQALLVLPARSRTAGSTVDAPPVRPGDPAASLLLQRMHSRQPQSQMPPLGTRVPDTEALALITRWIGRHLADPASSPAGRPADPSPAPIAQATRKDIAP